MKRFKTIDELTTAIREQTWYDDEGDGHVPNDIALDAIEQAVNITNSQVLSNVKTNKINKSEIIEHLEEIAKIAERMTTGNIAHARTSIVGSLRMRIKRLNESIIINDV